MFWNREFEEVKTKKYIPLATKLTIVITTVISISLVFIIYAVGHLLKVW